MPAKRLPRASALTRREFALSALAAGTSAVLAACSGGDEAAPTTSTAAPTTTTRPATTTAAPTTTIPATTTTLAPIPVYPLTGLPADDPAIAGRVAIVVKVDNAPLARPQTGFNNADIVVEEIVNDNITRFALLFHSGDADPVGPCRSGRLQDVDLFTMLNRPLFAWSGGNGTVTNAVNNSELINLSPTYSDAYFRRNDRRAPHNLYTTTFAIREDGPPFTGPPPQILQYRAPEAGAGGVPCPGLAVALDSIDVEWLWEPTVGVYTRTMEGEVHFDEATGPVTTNNVVVLAMEYVPGISNSPDAQTLGTGEVFVLSGGNYVHGTWARDAINQPFALTADDGSPILLTPGRTWIELPRTGSTLPYV
jgi:hypothetical protein